MRGGGLFISFIKKKNHDTEASKEKTIIQRKPRIASGINLVHKPEELPVFQSFVAAELEGRNNTAVWIDSKNESSTYALASFGSPGIMEKVRIGRAFTPFQHHSLIHQVDEFIQENTKLLVLPNLDYFYLDGQIKDWEAEELFQEIWKQILDLRYQYDLKVLVSLSSWKSDLTHPVIRDAENSIKVEKTSQGWKYESDDFEQHAYRDGGEVQTTVSCWMQKTTETVKVPVEAV
jgi:hypothetical protein